MSTHQLQDVVLLRHHQQVKTLAASVYLVYHAGVTLAADVLSVDTDHAVACLQPCSVSWSAALHLLHKDCVHWLIHRPRTQPQPSVPRQNLRQIDTAYDHN